MCSATSAKPDPCPLCASNRQPICPVYDLTRVCCCTRLVLAQPTLSRRQTALALIARRSQYADVAQVKAAVQAAFDSRRQKHLSPP
jgi:hypothetical protein